MAIIYVFNNDTNSIEKFIRAEDDPMPYTTNNSLKANEFRGVSESNILWTDKLTMETWNAFRGLYGKSIPVGYAFRRPWEGGHGQQSQHYAGTAFDTAQNMFGYTDSQRAELRNLAVDSGMWSYVEPVSISPTWVHFDKRSGPPACDSGYPKLSQGSRGQYVFILQDGLNAVGFNAGSPDGVFGNTTKTAVTNFQNKNALSATGVVDCNTWTKLQSLAVGIGKTSTVKD